MLGTLLPSLSYRRPTLKLSRKQEGKRGVWGGDRLSEFYPEKNGKGFSAG
jgi:hypothetical protein